MVQLLLVRHGETIWDSEKRLSGQSEVEISSLGKKQAKELGNYIKANYKVKLAFCSKLKRSIQTADIVSEIIGVKFSQVKEFADIDCGECTSMNHADLVSKYPALLKEWEKNTDPLFPSGENMALVEERAVKNIKKILDLCKEDDIILILSHASINQAVIGWLFEIPPALRFKIKQSHVCINEIFLDKEIKEFKLHKVNFSPAGSIKV